MIRSVLMVVALAASGAGDPPDVADLIARLGAESFDDRVAALTALEARGAEAIPALRAAADSGDARVRTRALALVETIGRRLDTERFAHPTLIAFNFVGQPLGEVIDTLNVRHDLGLVLRLGPEPGRGMVVFDRTQPQRLQELKARRVTIESPQPLPFWEAIDRLCAAGSLRYDAGTGMVGGRESFPLLADRTGRSPLVDSGPFRIQLLEVRTLYERDLTRDSPQPAVGAPVPGELTVALAVLAEPGLMIHPTGPAVVEEASDDQGRSLIPTSPTKPNPNQINQSAGNNSGRRSARVEATLAAPDPPGTTIRRLRGKVPVVAVAKAANPILIPLQEASGRTITNREVTLVVDQLPPQGPNAPPTVQVTFRFDGGFAAQRGDESNSTDFASFQRDRALDHLELRDATGRRLFHTTNGQMRGADSRGFYDRYQLVATTTPDGRGGFGRVDPAAPPPPVATELRFYPFVQSAIDLPFDFHDIPMP